METPDTIAIDYASETLSYAQLNERANRLAHYLRAILSQRLVRARNGKLVAAVELMLNTPHIKDLILKGDISAVKEAHKDSGEQGMQNFDDALLQLYKDGTITLEEAMSHADSRSNLEAKVNFGG